LKSDECRSDRTIERRAGNDYFCEFLMDALLRGDLKSRYEAYSLAIDHGWMSPNDARRNENMNPIAGRRYLHPADEYRSAGKRPAANDLTSCSTTSLH
jgi:phage portal protein BeeE